MKLVIDTQYGTYFSLDIPENEANSYVIDWGDGSDPETNTYYHRYTDASKEYTVTISGVVKKLILSSSGYGNRLIKIKQWGELGLTSLSEAFWECTNLREIASPTKNSFKDVTDFSYCFGRTKITSIPENLFANCPNATDFSYCFYRTEITSIPYDLFKYCNKAKSFEETFGHCYELSNYLPLWDKDYYNDGNNDINEGSGRGCYGNCSDEMDTNEVPPNIIGIWWEELYEGEPPAS